MLMMAHGKTTKSVFNNNRLFRAAVMASDPAKLTSSRESLRSAGPSTLLLATDVGSIREVVVFVAKGESRVSQVGIRPSYLKTRYEADAKGTGLK